MIPIKTRSGDSTKFCPYDKSHVILAKGFNAHLLKCRQNHLDVPTVVCRFDKTHVVPRPEKAYHESECPSQYLLDRERQKRAGDIGLRGDVQGPAIVADHNTAVIEEDWTLCPPPAPTPALFNEKKPRENFVGPYIPSGSSGQSQTSQGELSKNSHNLPQTSSIAASVALPAPKTKKHPSAVFEYTTGYGRGRGKINAVTKPSAQPLFPPSDSPVRGQFEDKDADSQPLDGQLAEIKQNSANIKLDDPSPTATKENESMEKQLQFLREREEYCFQQLCQLKLQHIEDSKKLNENQQQQLLLLQQRNEEEQRQMMKVQEQSLRQLDEHMNQLRQLMSQYASSSTSAAHIPPPGFDKIAPSVSPLPGGASGDPGVLCYTTNTGEQKEKKLAPEVEESWHEESPSENGLDLFTLGATVNGSNKKDHVTSWLSSQPIDDIDETRMVLSGIENTTEIEKQKRKLEKKLRQIGVLEQKVSLGHNISVLEEEKLRQNQPSLLSWPL